MDVKFTPQLKTVPSDFLVSEVMFLDLCMHNSVKYRYYKITKSGFTSFDAIAHVADFFSVSKDNIGYAGLKDEDGVTEQYISVDQNLSDKLIDKFNSDYFTNENNFLRINITGYGDKSIQTGELLGNNFRVKIRNLEHTMAKKIAEAKKHCFYFFNYYGSQRFGLPNSIKNTHIIGNYIINEKYKEALTLLSNQVSRIGDKAKNALIRGVPPAIFFNKELDSKLTAFFQSAYYSHIWNEDLKHLIKNSEIPYHIYKESEISYLFSQVVKVNSLPNFLPYIRVIPGSNAFEKQNLSRQVILQLNVICHNFHEDIYNNDKWACDVSFFLPSGVYATVAIYQFINQLISQVYRYGNAFEKSYASIPT
jgi:tRNA pseudouridine13 synthase